MPPTVPPPSTPAVVPSGAFVFFSDAKSLEDCLSAIRTETSSFEKPAA